MIYVCTKCGETFESQGVQIIVHDETIGHVCPSCIAGADSFHLIVQRVAAGKYTLKHVEVQRSDLPSKEGKGDGS